MNHWPWDNGSIAKAFDEVLGFHVEHKTVKAKCGKRVPCAQGSTEAAVTCQDCRAALARERDDSRHLVESISREFPQIAAKASMSETIRWADAIDRILERA